MSLPHHPLLRPGVWVTRRGDGQLQIGLDPSVAVVAPDCPATREFLDCLKVGTPARLTPQVTRLADALMNRGLVVDADHLMADLTRQPGSPHAIAAAYAQTPAARALLAQRRGRAVLLEAGLPSTLKEHVSGLAEQLLGLSGVPTGGDPYAVLAVQIGEFDRNRSDSLVRREMPHLLLTVSEGIVRLGPFVVPGLTACLRCVDAHVNEADPRRALVVEQYAHRARPRPDGVPEPVDTSVLTAALAWATRDLVSFIDDEVPTTWSTTIRFGPGVHQQRTTWPRSARCGCSWTETSRGP
jgi:hypothetical protein